MVASPCHWKCSHGVSTAAAPHSTVQLKVTGGDGQHPSAGFLGIADVVRNFAVPVAGLIAIMEAGGEEVGAFQPAEFFAVWTIGEHPAHVGAQGGVDDPMRAVVNLARAMEGTGLGQGVAHVDQLEPADDRQIPGVRVAVGNRSGDFDELHAQIERKPLMRQRLAVHDHLAADQVSAERSVFSVFVFAAAEVDAVAGLATIDFHPQLRRHVLREAVEEHVGLRFVHRGRLLTFERGEARPEPGHQPGRGGFGLSCRLPAAIVKSNSGPAVMLAARIEIFSGEDVGEGNGPRRSAPRVIGADRGY